MAEQQLVDLGDIAGLTEIAHELGVSPQAVANWTAGRCRPGFPGPVKRLKATPLYSISEVTRWYTPWRLEDRTD